MYWRNVDNIHKMPIRCEYYDFKLNFVIFRVACLIRMLDNVLFYYQVHIKAEIPCQF